MSNTEDSNHLPRNGIGETWAEKVAKGMEKRIPNAMQNKNIYGEQINIAHEVMYEDDLLKDHLRIHKAEQIAQRA
ncbi:hypothetical protein G6F27_014377 [Rhizopus arrhizus]|nr:hypothetical protein G6F27_014377 [Rhizopus arrhizus]